MNSTDLQRIFRQLPGLFLVLEPDPGFTIVAASEDYLRVARKDERIYGQPLFEVFPDNPANSEATGSRDLRASLQRVVAAGKPDALPTLRYDILRAEADGGGFEERYWLSVNTPVLDAEGQVEYIVHRAEDATPRANRLLLESENQRRIYETALDSTPDFIYVFDLEHRAIYANEALVKTWGVGDVRGKKWMELGYEQWHADLHDAEIDRVIATRAPIRGEIPFTGTNGRRIYDYIFAPVLGPGGDVVAVAGTTRDITERQSAEQAIREQAERLAESDRAKDEFLATLSHELRNPLAPLRNSIALLRMNEDDRSAGVHAMMERQINHLVRLVDDLLEVSRISRGAFSLRNERVDLAAIVRNAAEASGPLMEAGRHELAVDLEADPLWIEGDPVRVAQILDNLLNNAAKYTQDGGRISISARSDAGQAVVTIRDNGPGISAAAMPRIFEMFSRGDPEAGRSPGGLGIGLALSRRLAQMHGGTLEGHSDGPGMGSEFTVRLPLAEAGQATEATAPAAGAADPLARTRVLVVDDNEDAGDSLGQILELLGADVKVERDGAGALDAFASYQPSVVLLDIGMPGMNGYEVARTIRTRFPERPATLVALTGWGQDDDRRRAREAGFDHHLVKPAELAALQELLSSLQ